MCLAENFERGVQVKRQCDEKEELDLRVRSRLKFWPHNYMPSSKPEDISGPHLHNRNNNDS